jgi:hypothetical protein
MLLLLLMLLHEYGMCVMCCWCLLMLQTGDRGIPAVLCLTLCDARDELQAANIHKQ